MKKILFLIYTGLLFCLSVFSFVFVDPNLSYFKDIFTGFAFQNRGISTIIYIIFVIFLYLLYLIFLHQVYLNKLNKEDIKFLIGLTVITLLIAYPAMLSYDMFNYLFTAKVLFFYHENPYIIMPIEFIGDPFLSFTHAANKIALYGPVWIVFTGIPYLLSFGNFIFLLFGFKLFVAVFYILTIILIWKTTKNLFQTTLFALNPLIIIETLLSGHNDIVMIFFALFSFYFVRRKNILLGIFLLVLSILIKYATIFLIPVFFYCMWKIYTNQKIEWDKIYFVSAILMLFVFCLSPIREEIYPWYAIWFLGFVPFLPTKKFIIKASVVLSFSLLLRYVPYMYLGTYLSPTPILKNVISFIPLSLFSIYYVFKKKI